MAWLQLRGLQYIYCKLNLFKLGLIESGVVSACIVTSDCNTDKMKAEQDKKYFSGAKCLKCRKLIYN